MAETHCPLCYTHLEVRDVAPCFDCGHDPVELGHLASGEHEYSEVLAFGVPVILCDHCEADFASYDPEYFNRPKDTRLGIGKFVFVRVLKNATVARDKYCPVCNHRLAFLRFVVQARSIGTAGDEP